ncbi:MAG: toprim domain-containing protein [Phycisphaerales bacterium]|nr:toprim domain-containing protein [Phycisphaerales bacterium]
MSHPELVELLLERLGGRNISAFSRGFTCTCPIHANSDNDGAFVVWFNQERMIWKCHTRCAAQGGLADLLVRKYNASFQQAVTWLAQFAGITISGPIMQVSPEQIQEETLATMKRRFGLSSQENGPVFFDESWVAWSQRYWQTPGGQVACDFLAGPLGTHNAYGEKRKGFPFEILCRFDIGFVPGGCWVRQNPDAPDKQIGWFDDRISIPWRMPGGQLIGFAGRRIDGQKYMKFQNYPHTKKAYALYGLHLPETQAEIQKERVLVLVEGYGDVWRGHQFGIHNVVAVGGVELTPQQISLMTSFDLDCVVLFYDGDTAGITTARKMANQLRDKVKVRVASCPDGYDPDDLPDRQAYLHQLEHSRLA